jgi:hypothetical protein
MPCALPPTPAGSARCYAGASGLTIPMLLLGGLLLPAAAPAARAATCGTTNLALNQPTTASSTENASFPASAAVELAQKISLLHGNGASATVTFPVTGTSASGATAATTFVWTISPPSS